MINLEGLKTSGSSKCFESFMIKDTFAMNVECGGNEYSPTEVVVVVRWGREVGATLASL